jgi:hypothetical protein
MWVTKRQMSVADKMSEKKSRRTSDQGFSHGTLDIESRDGGRRLLIKDIVAALAAEKGSLCF